MSAPPRVRDHLRRAPDGPRPVLHRGRHAVYVDVDGRCVGVVAAGATRVPCALRSSAPDLAGLSGGSAHLAGGVLHLGGTPLVVGRLLDVRLPRLDLRAVRHHPAEPSARPPAAVAALLGQLRVPARLDAGDVARLVGRGEGLTPLGDDLLCGWLATHRAAEVATPDVDAAVRALLPRTTPLSAGLLDCALHGEAVPELTTYLRCLGRPGEPAAAAALAAIGHTSGAGLLHGARLALAGLRHRDGLAA